MLVHVVKYEKKKKKLKYNSTIFLILLTQGIFLGVPTYHISCITKSASTVHSDSKHQNVFTDIYIYFFFQTFMLDKFVSKDI